MKIKSTLAALALALVLGAFTPIAATLSSGVTYVSNVAMATDGAAESEEKITDEASFKAAKKDGATIVLDDDIELTGSVSFVNMTVTIDLNGHNITAKHGGEVLNFWGAAKVNIINSSDTVSKISGTGSTTKGVLALHYNYVSSNGDVDVTVGENVTIEAKGGMYAVSIVDQTAKGTGFDLAFTLNGNIDAEGSGISISGNIKDTAHIPTVKIGDKASIKSGAVPIYAAGIGNWTIGSATIEGERSIGIKSGSMTLTGTKVTVKTDARPETENGFPELDTNGIDAYGAVFQIEDNKAYADNVHLTIKSGTYVRENSYIFEEYGNTDKPAAIVIEGGSFTAGEKAAILHEGMGSTNISINGASTFTGDLTGFKGVAKLASDLEMSDSGVVSKKPTTPSIPDTSDKEDKETTVEDKTGTVTVTGDFGDDKVHVEVEPSNHEIPAFDAKDFSYALYDIQLLDDKNVKYNFDGTVTVSIKVPAGLDGSKSSIYYIKDDYTLGERMKSTHKDGVITFETTHFTYYAIVADGGATAPDLAATPDTGVLGHHITNAVNSLLPLLAVAALMSLVGIRRLAHRRAEK